jgi:hypothetical protein
LAANAFEIERAAFRKFESGAGDKIGYNARHKNLVRAALRHDARGGVHRDPADILAPYLDFAGVKAGAQRESNLPRSRAEGERATHRAPRSVEGCENAVACALHKISAMPLDRLFRQTIVTIEQFVPALVSDFHRHTRGADDVGEENGRQDPIRFRNSAIAMSGDEFLNVADQPLASYLPNSAISRSFPSWVPVTRFIDRPVPHAATVAVRKASNASSVLKELA